MTATPMGMAHDGHDLWQQTGTFIEIAMCNENDPLKKPPKYSNTILH